VSFFSVFSLGAARPFWFLYRRPLISCSTGSFFKFLIFLQSFPSLFCWRRTTIEDLTRQRVFFFFFCHGVFIVARTSLRTPPRGRGRIRMTCHPAVFARLFAKTLGRWCFSAQAACPFATNWFFFRVWVSFAAQVRTAERFQIGFFFYPLVGGRKFWNCCLFPPLFPIPHWRANFGVGRGPPLFICGPPL